MHTNGKDTHPARTGQSSGNHGEPLGAALISADDHLRQALVSAIRDEGLPVWVDLEIAASGQLQADQMERLRSAAPHVVVLDMGSDPERAIWTIGAITSAHPAAAVVGVGPDLDAPRLLDAVRAGMVEYVPRPVDPDQLADALRRVMRKRGWADVREGRRNGKVLAFFSAKGGCGSTSVVTNVGIELHRLTGKKTLLVDLDLELGEIASLVGIRPRFHFVDLVRNFHRMDADLLASYIESHASGVQVLSAPFEPEIGEEVSGEQIARILGFLRDHYDYVLVDTSKSLAPPALAALQSADQIFLVTNMDVPSLRNMKRCLPILDRVTAGDAGRLRVVVNRYNPKSLVRVQDLEETLGLEVFCTLTNDYDTVIQASSTGQPLVEGNSRYAEQLKELARAIADTPRATAPAKESIVGRILSPFRSAPGRARTPLRTKPTEAPTHG